MRVVVTPTVTVLAHLAFACSSSWLLVSSTMTLNDDRSVGVGVGIIENDDDAITNIINTNDAPPSSSRLTLLDPVLHDRIANTHDRAFRALAESYAQRGRPSSRSDMLEDLFDVLGDGDDVLRDEDGARRRRWRERAASAVSARTITWPVDVDPVLRDVAEEAFAAITTRSSRSTSSLARSLNDVWNDVRRRVGDGTTTNPVHVAAILSGLAVAVASAELWTKVYSDDRHPLHGLHDEASYYRRRDDEGAKGRRTREADDDHRHDDDYHHHDDHDDNNTVIVGGGIFHLLFGGVGAFLGSVVENVVAYIVGTTTGIAFWAASTPVVVANVIVADGRGAVIGVLEFAEEYPSQIFDAEAVFYAAVDGAVLASGAYLDSVEDDFWPTPSPTKAPTGVPTPWPRTKERTTVAAIATADDDDARRM